jgi:TRAP-type C4-dicarboxylate transport system permease small subunit
MDGVVNSQTYGQIKCVGHWLRRRAADVLVALLSIMFVCFIIQIFWRYFLNNPVGWTEEVIITSWLWTVLWGAAFILTEAEEIRFDIIYSNISENVRRVFTVVTGIIAASLYAISLPASYKYVSFMKVERSAYLHIPINILYSIYVIFAVASICRFVWFAFHAARGGKAPETDPALLKE